VKVSWDDFSIPNWFWKVIIHSMVPVTTNQHLSSHIIPYHPIFIYWLVVLTIFKHLSQWEGLSHILWKIKFMLETTNQYIIGNISHYMSSHYVPIPIINGRLIKSPLYITVDPFAAPSHLLRRLGTLRRAGRLRGLRGRRGLRLRRLGLDVLLGCAACGTSVATVSPWGKKWARCHISLVWLGSYQLWLYPNYIPVIYGYISFWKGLYTVIYWMISRKWTHLSPIWVPIVRAAR
jgi:hypothetical protein